MRRGAATARGPAVAESAGKESVMDNKGVMTGPMTTAIRGKLSTGLGGTIWFAGWLFTIGFAKLVWWKALLGLVVWPYFLAGAVR
jgi:hypothetical protein